MMPKRLLQKIQHAVATGEYDLSFHASEELAEDGLDIFDLEAAVFNGRLTKIETDDPRGTRCTMVGRARDERTPVGMVGRFTETGIFLVITVYQVTELEE